MSRVFQECFNEVFSCMDLIAATQAEGGLVSSRFYIIFKNRGVKPASSFLLRTKVKFKNNQLLKLSNVLSFNNNFNLGVLINFFLKKDIECSIQCIYYLEYYEWKNGEGIFTPLP